MRVILSVLIFSFAILSCNQKLLLDKRDGEKYKTVKIGDKVWMAENLAYKPDSGKYWAYDNDNSKLSVYGYLYEWNAARKVCPTDWHLPSSSDWSALIDDLGGKEVAASKLKSITGWNNNKNGTNESGFNAFPGGMRADVGWYDGYGNHANWFGTSSSNNEINLMLMTLSNDGYLRIMELDTSLVLKKEILKHNMYASIRCVKD